ncbi:MAG: MBL fold metallo-hydrolase [Cyclobacteriaceae bacterium]
MKILLSTLLFFSLLFSIHSQTRDNADRIATDQGDLIIQPITHGTVALEWNSQTIYVDPYGGAEKFEGLNDPDIILITDIHGDHLNMKTLEAINTSKAQFFVPQAVMDKLPESMQAKAIVINNGSATDFNGINIAAIPMYNLPDDESSRHKKGRGNGYVLTMGGKKVYLSGDTEDIPEMRALKNIDVAFICMNLPYTMDINQAASAVSEFKPGIVYPYHYRGSGGLSDVEGFKLLVNETSAGVEVRLKNWYMN